MNGNGRQQYQRGPQGQFRGNKTQNQNGNQRSNQNGNQGGKPQTTKVDPQEKRQEILANVATILEQLNVEWQDDKSKN